MVVSLNRNLKNNLKSVTRYGNINSKVYQVFAEVLSAQQELWELGSIQSA